MKCDKCGEDKDYFGDMVLVARKDNTKNCGSIFNPTRRPL